jgi:hypothetical protein
VTLVAFNSRHYRALSAAYAKIPNDDAVHAGPSCVN